jgi:hypothetical protein
VAQVARIRLTERGSVPLGVHLRCRFHRCELIGPAVGEAASVFGRFQSGDPNEQWKGDEMHGPHVADRQTYLSAFLDDQSRLLAGYPFGFAAESARGGPRRELRGRRQRMLRRSCYEHARNSKYAVHSAPSRITLRAGKHRTVLPHRGRTIPGRGDRHQRCRPRRLG